MKTNTNFDFLKIPQPMKYYPNNIFRFDFNENTYLSPAVLYIGHDSLIFTVLDLDISIIEVKKDYIELEVLFQSSKEIISCNVNGKFHSENKSIMVKNRNDVMSLIDYLNTYPLVFYTTTDDRISEGEISQGSIDRSYFEPKVIRNIDWEGFNTDIRKEFFKSDVERKAFKDKNSLQDTVKEILELDSNN
ncbi:MAG: hypothetical protein WBJ13_07275, partial [Sedimentibacter sp.]